MEGYQGFNLQHAQGMRANTAAPQQALQNVQGLQQSLSGFYQNSMQMYGEAAVNEAVDQAAKDDANGEPFHKESIHTLYGKAYNNAREATYASQVEMTMDEANTQMQIDYRNDPAGYRNTFKNYYEGLSKDAPTAQLKGTMLIMGRKLMNSTYGTLVLNKKKEDDKFAIETYNQNTDMMLGKAINATVAGDTATADLLKTNHISKLQALKNDGIINEATFIEELRGLNQRLDSGTRLRTLDKLIQENNLDAATKLVDEFDKSIPEIYSPEEHQTVSNSLNTMLNSAKKIQKANITEARKEIDAAVKDVTELFKNNKQPENLPSDEVIANASPSVKKDYNIAKSAYNWVVKEFNKYDLNEQGLVYAQLSGKNPVSGITDLEIQKMAKKIIDNRIAGWKADPITQGVEENINQATRPLTTSNIKEYPALIAARKQQLKNNKAVVGDYAPDYLLTKSEAEGFANYFDSDVPASDKIEVLEGLFISDPEAAKMMIKQFDKENYNSLAFAGGLIINGQSEAARLSFMGNKLKIKLDDDITLRIADSIRGVFTHFSANKYNQVIAGVQDYIKGMSKEEGIDIMDIKAEEITKSLIGERIELNGKAILLPLNKSEKSFNNWINAIKIPESYKLDEGVRTKLEGEIQTLDDFFGKSNKYQLHYAGQNKYALYDIGAGFVTDDAGQPIILEYGK